MKKEKQKQLALEHINSLFEEAERNAIKKPEYASDYIKMAKKIAMRFNIKIPKQKRKFCKKCFSFFTSKNSEKRIKKGKIIIKCLKCNNIQRYGLKM